MSSKQTYAAHLITLVVLFIVVGPVAAQQPSPSPTPKKSEFTDTPAETGEKAGDFTVISSLEVGYRGLRVDGDLNKYQSDLNYKAGPRVFDSSFLMKSTDGKGGLFDTLLVTSTGVPGALPRVLSAMAWSRSRSAG